MTTPMPTDPIQPAMDEVLDALTFALFRRTYDFYELVASQLLPDAARCPENIYQRARKCVALAYALKVLSEQADAQAKRESA